MLLAGNDPSRRISVVGRGGLADGVFSAAAVKYQKVV
jgi:hypothetical protein